MNNPPRILYCHCANARVLPAQTRAAVLRKLCDAGLPFDAVPDLCALSARRDPLLQEFAASGSVVVAACHPRAVSGLFAAAAASLSPGTTKFLDLRSESPQSICTALCEISKGRKCSPPRDFQTLFDQLESAPALPDAWNAWAPVIDYDFCTGCMQCLSFCLFGVYGVNTDSRIEARNPEQCKTNCPACARVCPEAAIIFPKHGADEINGGMAAGSDRPRETMKVDLSTLFGGDLYARLRERNSQPRFSKERDPDQALQERRRHLAAFAQAGGIPPEVFNNLPSPDEIARRVTEAKAKARAALEQKSARP